MEVKLIVLISLFLGIIVGQQTIVNPANCGFGQFYSTQRECVECPLTCPQCQSLVTPCRNCPEGFLLNSISSSCTRCNQGFLYCNTDRPTVCQRYYRKQNQKCFPSCQIQNCRTCKTIISCQVCNDGFKLDNQGRSCIRNQARVMDNKRHLQSNGASVNNQPSSITYSSILQLLSKNNLPENFLQLLSQAQGQGNSAANRQIQALTQGFTPEQIQTLRRFNISIDGLNSGSQSGVISRTTVSNFTTQSFSSNGGSIGTGSGAGIGTGGPQIFNRNIDNSGLNTGFNTGLQGLNTGGIGGLTGLNTISGGPSTTLDSRFTTSNFSQSFSSSNGNLNLPSTGTQTTSTTFTSGGLNTGGISAGSSTTGARGLNTGGLSTGGLSTGGLSTGGLSTGTSTGQFTTTNQFGTNNQFGTGTGSLNQGTTQVTSMIIPSQVFTTGSLPGGKVYTQTFDFYTQQQIKKFSGIKGPLTDATGVIFYELGDIKYIPRSPFSTSTSTTTITTINNGGSSIGGGTFNTGTGSSSTGIVSGGSTGTNIGGTTIGATTIGGSTIGGTTIGGSTIGGSTIGGSTIGGSTIGGVISGGNTGSTNTGTIFGGNTLPIVPIIQNSTTTTTTTTTIITTNGSSIAPINPTPVIPINPSTVTPIVNPTPVTPIVNPTPVVPVNPTPSTPTVNTIQPFQQDRNCKTDQYFDRTRQNCQPCDRRCMTCVRTSDQCLQCNIGYLSQGWKCISNNSVLYNMSLVLPANTNDREILLKGNGINTFKRQFIQTYLPSYDPNNLGVISILDTVLDNQRGLLNFSGYIQNPENRVNLVDLNRSLTDNVILPLNTKGNLAIGSYNVTRANFTPIAGNWGQPNTIVQQVVNPTPVPPTAPKIGDDLNYAAILIPSILGGLCLLGLLSTLLCYCLKICCFQKKINPTTTPGFNTNRPFLVGPSPISALPPAVSPIPNFSTNANVPPVVPITSIIPPVNPVVTTPVVTTPVVTTPIVTTPVVSALPAVNPVVTTSVVSTVPAVQPSTTMVSTVPVVTPPVPIQPVANPQLQTISTSSRIQENRRMNITTSPTNQPITTITTSTPPAQVISSKRFNSQTRIGSMNDFDTTSIARGIPLNNNNAISRNNSYSTNRVNTLNNIQDYNYNSARINSTNHNLNNINNISRNINTYQYTGSPTTRVYQNTTPITTTGTRVYELNNNQTRNRVISNYDQNNVINTINTMNNMNTMNTMNTSINNQRIATNLDSYSITNPIRKSTVNQRQVTTIEQFGNRAGGATTYSNMGSMGTLGNLNTGNVYQGKVTQYKYDSNGNLHSRVISVGELGNQLHFSPSKSKTFEAAYNPNANFNNAELVSRNIKTFTNTAQFIQPMSSSRVNRL